MEHQLCSIILRIYLYMYLCKTLKSVRQIREQCQVPELASSLEIYDYCSYFNRAHKVALSATSRQLTNQPADNFKVWKDLCHCKTQTALQAFIFSSSATSIPNIVKVSHQWLQRITFKECIISHSDHIGRLDW